MNQDSQQAVASGAHHVEETEQLASGLAPAPEQIAAPTLQEREVRDGVSHEDVRIVPKGLLLTMLRQGEGIQVRVGSATDPSNAFEGRFDSAEEAHTALRDAGVLTEAQSQDASQLPAPGLALEDVSTSQLSEAGLHRLRSTSSL